MILACLKILAILTLGWIAFKLFFVDKEFTLKYDLVAERSVAASDLSWQRVANNLNDLSLTANDESVKEKLEISWWPAFNDLIAANLNDDDVTPKWKESAI